MNTNAATELLGGDGEIKLSAKMYTDGMVAFRLGDNVIMVTHDELRKVWEGSPEADRLSQAARRYERLRILGCAPAYSKHLERAEVVRFTNLDEFVDGDIKWTPSRGGAPQRPAVPGTYNGE